MLGTLGGATVGGAGGTGLGYGLMTDLSKMSREERLKYFGAYKTPEEKKDARDHILLKGKYKDKYKQMNRVHTGRYVHEDK